MTTTKWGPLTRVIDRQAARRIEDVQQGTRWLVRRVRMVTMRSLTKGGAIRHGEDRYQTVVTELGEVRASDKYDAERIAERLWGGNVVVQSAISAALAREEQEAVEKLRRAKSHHYRRR